MVDDITEGRNILAAINRQMKAQYNIDHVTIQLEDQADTGGPR